MYPCLTFPEKTLKTEPPVVQEAPKMVNVQPGQTAEITVTVTGHPEPVIEWYKNKQMLIPGDKYLV